MKQTNLSIFIPHYGCPNCCSFCNQRTISGTKTPPTAEEVFAILSEQQKVLSEKEMCAEIAFFGGSFTAIDREYMTALLKTAQHFTTRYPAQFCGIRCSTRPDCISREILDILREYGMTTIELGAQSMNDTVLSSNRRGHTAEDVRKAAALIKEYGFSLGLQMMTGLLGDTDELAIQTAKQIIDFGADTLILGCTHYPVLQDAIRKVLGADVTLINAGTTTAKAVATFIRKENLENQNGGERKFFVSDKPAFFKEQAGVLLGPDVDTAKIEKVDINSL